MNNPFANVVLSPEAKRLANAIYNTYIQEKYPYIDIPVKRLYQMFCTDSFTHSKSEFEHLLEIFEELNEPVALINFKYGSKTYDWKMIQFCEFESDWKPGDEYVEIQLNEMYIAAMKEYMDEPFLPLGSKD
ncbi:MAG: hypothetical protein U9Q62_10195 [Campylobacterota bacterium]|nr:hypothetical protein [Campylobacterota bacterium]